MIHTRLTSGDRQRVFPARLMTGIASFAWLMRRIRQLDGRLLGRQVEEPQTDDEVLAWAGRIAATEPRFAAELHAIVLRKQALEG